MDERATLARTLVEIAAVPDHAADTAPMLTAVSRLCPKPFEALVWVSITLGDPAEPVLVATDSQEAQAVDGAQVMAGEGPCHDAWALGTLVTVDDLHEDGRWPRLAAQARELPVRAAIAAPLSVADETVGALNVYSPGAGRLQGQSVTSAELIAAAVAALLREVRCRTELAEITRQLHSALESRATIDQAKGIVMAHRRCDADEAFQFLVQRSSETNVKLREVARRLVEETTARTP